MEEQLYWVWMSLAFGPANINTHKLLQRYPNPRDLYEAVQWLEEPPSPLTQDEFKRIREVTLDKAKEVLTDCERKHIQVVNMTEPHFPQRLLHIYNPPILLYYLGEYLPFNDHLVLTMVGSREVTRNGYEIGRRIAYELARRDIIVVSGMALGGDSSAHLGALEAQGYTAAVIGCGCDINYPSANRELHVRVARNGCILSEFPPGTRPEPRNFIMRNRILAGMANGVVVTECHPRSGALSTVNYALEEGRDVFAVPSSALDEAHGGTFNLLKDGAVPVRKAEDILEHYDTAQRYRVPTRSTKQDELSAQNKTKTPDSRKKPKAKSDVGASDEKPLKPIQNELQESELTTQSISESETVTAVPDAVIARSENRVADMRKNTVQTPVEILSPSSDTTREVLEELGERAQILYNLLEEHPKYIDKLITESGLTPSEVLATMIELECASLCESLPGQRYTLPISRIGKE